jgi:uncharacterized RDD family membrane protein YckC
MATPVPDLPHNGPELVFPSFGGYITTPGALEGVSFWPRAAARVIDFVVHYLVAFFSGMLFIFMLSIASGGHIPRMMLWHLRHPGLTGFVFSLFGSLAYQLIFTTVHGSSMGKRLLSMVVVQEDRTPCSIKSALIRELSYYIDALFFGIIAYTSMQKSTLEQRHGDEWAHTIVCKRSLVSQENLRGAGRFIVALVFALAADSALLMTGWLVVIAS